jgi:stage III sporulation protein AC
LTDLSPIYRIAGLGILIAVLNIFLIQADRKEQAQMLSLAGVIIVLLWLVQMVGQLFSSVEAVFRW